MRTILFAGHRLDEDDRAVRALPGRQWRPLRARHPRRVAAILQSTVTDEYAASPAGPVAATFCFTKSVRELGIPTELYLPHSQPNASSPSRSRRLAANGYSASAR